MTAVISGIGQTEYAHELAAPADTLALRATLAAAADAGLVPRAIDGIVSYPGHPDAETMIANLGLPDVRFRASTTIGGAAAVSAVGLAAMAVRAGAASHVLVLRATRAGTGTRKEKAAEQMPNPELRSQLELPVGWNSAAQRYALLARAFMADHDLTRDHLAEVALAARAHAQLNPAAQLYGKPLTREQYLAGRVIADPFWRHDCCLRTDGACAVIVSRGEDASGRAVPVIAAAEGHPATPDDMVSRPRLLDTGLARAAARLWSHSEYQPSDVDAAMIYDCFTFEVAHQLVAGGFVGADEVGAFIASGAIRIGGRLPVNTHGGLLAEANMSGLSHVLEAVRQLRGEAGERQLPSPRLIAVIGWGYLGDGSIALLGGHDG
jgi:acetyl-CoA acetyltransferase